MSFRTCHALFSHQPAFNTHIFVCLPQGGDAVGAEAEGEAEVVVVGQEEQEEEDDHEGQTLSSCHRYQETFQPLVSIIMDPSVN